MESMSCDHELASGGLDPGAGRPLSGADRCPRWPRPRRGPRPANSAVSRATWRSVSRSAPVCRVRRARYSGSCARPRCPCSCCWTRRRHSSKASAAEADDVERVHHRDRRWQLLGRGGLEPGEPVHRDHLERHHATPSAGPRARSRTPAWSGLGVMSRRRAGPLPLRIGVRSMMTVTYLSPLPGVPPHVLIDADDLDALEAVRVRDQGPSALGEDRVVGGVPRHTERRPRSAATDRCPTTNPSRAHRRPRREIFARAGAAREVS